MPLKKRTVKKRSVKAGLPPGSLVLVGETRDEAVSVELIDFTDSTLTEEVVTDLQQLRETIDRPSVTWVNLHGLHDTAAIETIGQIYGIHNLVLEDILNTDHRPKVELFEDYAFFTMKMMSFVDDEQLDIEQLSIVFGKHYVLCFQEKKGDIFNPIRERIRTDIGLIRKKGNDFLVYRLIDSVVDNYFIIIERIEERVESLEILITADEDGDHMQTIQQLKREIITLKRALLPLREAVSGLEKGITPLVEENNRKYYRDVYDHLLQISETLESNREVLSGLMDMHLANLSNRMNKVMKVLTVIASLFIPLTFIAGIYGMNFDNMPELHWKYGYYAAWGLMLSIFLLMLYYFKRKNWF